MTAGARPRVVVVGLGPGDAGLVTEQTRAAIDRIPVRFLRTALTGETEGDCDRPALVARGLDDVTVVWLADASTAPVPRTRTRGGGGGVTGAPRQARGPAVALAVAPNPLRAGAAFALRGADAGEVVEFFDASGRRLATLHAGADGRLVVDRASTRPWPSGLVFARTARTARTARFVVLH